MVVVVVAATTAATVVVPGHLTKDQHPVATRLQFRQQFVQQLQFPAVVDQMFPHRVQLSILHPVEQVGVVAHFSQLHHNVAQFGPPHVLSTGHLEHF